MKTQNVAVISIHPDPASLLKPDLKDILAALNPHCERWIWCVRNLDCLGENCEDLCQQVDAAGPAGKWMSTKNLRDLSNGVYQTIEGEFVAFPKEIDPKTVKSDDVDLRAFPANGAELAIQAVDGAYFEVYSKDAEFLARLRQFKNVRDEDPDMYF